MTTVDGADRVDLDAAPRQPPPRPRGGVFRVAVREVRRAASSPLLVVLMAVLPVVCVIWLRGIFAAPVARDLPMAWMDEDESPVSRTLLRMVDATPSIALRERVTSMADAEHLVRTGRVYGVIVVPAGFATDLVRGDTPTITGFYNSQLLLAAGLVSRDLQAAVLTASAGIEQAGARRRGTARARLDPLIEPVRTRTHVLFNPQLNYDYAFTATLLPTLLQMLAMMTAVVAIGLEFKESTGGAWLAAAGGRPWAALGGKLLAHAAWFGLLVTAMLAIVFDGIGTPLRGDGLVVIAGAWLFVLACLGVGAAIVGSCRSLRLAASLVAFYTGIAYPFMGVTFPVAAMPAAAQAWAKAIPLSHFLALLLDEGLRGTGAASRGAILALALFAAGGVVAGWIGVRALLLGRRAWSVS